VIRERNSAPSFLAVGFEGSFFHQKQRKVRKLEQNDPFVDLSIRKIERVLVERKRSFRVANGQTHNRGSDFHRIDVSIPTDKVRRQIPWGAWAVFRREGFVSIDNQADRLPDNRDVSRTPPIVSIRGSALYTAAFLHSGSIEISA